MSNKTRVTSVHKSTIDEFILTAPQFSFLRNVNIREDNIYRWNRVSDNTVMYWIQVMFIGQTGYGKSATLNKICGKTFFKSDDINSCTKALYCSEYKIHTAKEHYFSLCDLPGMGESSTADRQYAEWYDAMQKYTSCVVHILRADKRDFAIDRNIINILRKNDPELKKVLFAINYADKIEPLSRSYPFEPSYEQIKNLELKKETSARDLGVARDKFIYYSATTRYNFDTLLDKISSIVVETIKNQ
jgi:predicted GTPase